MCLAACSFHAGVAEVADAPGSGQHDAPISKDGEHPAPEGPSQTCFGSQGAGGYYVCAPSAPSGSAMVTGSDTLDTGTECTGSGTLAAATVTLDEPGGKQQSVCLLYAAGVTVTGSITATGSLPLVIASTADVTIMGTIDVASSDSQSGAGYTNTGCSDTISGTHDGTGGGGGAGGSFSTSGGSGGDGGAGTGGAPQTNVIANALTGGCLGGAGGSGDVLGGSGGYGGGAVYVVAAGNIIVSGTINASGAGGLGGLPGNDGDGSKAGGGGGGGGTGGMILLDAAGGAGALMLTSSGILIADGGGGGGGGDDRSDTGGSPGTNPSNPMNAAGGGSDGGLAGGSGSSGALGSGTGSSGSNHQGGSKGGGGGGGGGEGFIWVIGGGIPANSNNTNTSPPMLPVGSASY